MSLYLVPQLQQQTLVVAPEKVQKLEPFESLGYVTENQRIRPQTVSLRTQSLWNLNDFQQLLGDMNWIRPFLHRTADDMKPLFDILKGDHSPSSPQTLNESAKQRSN